MKSISNDHPTEASLIPDAKKTIEGIIQFIKDKKIVTIPSEVRPTIMETPPYARSGAFASMDTPGPYEAKATEAFYYVTPPEKEWDAKHKEEHLRLYNPPIMNIITIHEAYPGHYIQFLNAKAISDQDAQDHRLWHECRRLGALRRADDAGGRLSGTAIRSSGWPSFRRRCCAMPDTSSASNSTPRVGPSNRAQSFSKRRHFRNLRMHTKKRAAVLTIRRIFTTRLGNCRSTSCGRIIEKQRGRPYSLQGFHDEFVKQGSIPIKVIRRILLPDDNGPSL